MRPCFPRSPTPYITDRPAALCHSLSQLACYHARRSDILLLQFNVLPASEAVCNLLRTKLAPIFCFSTPFHIFISSISSVVKEDAEALVVATKEIGLEVNADRTKYMVVLGSECRAGSQCED